MIPRKLEPRAKAPAAEPPRRTRREADSWPPHVTTSVGERVGGEAGGLDDDVAGGAADGAAGDVDEAVTAGGEDTSADELVVLEASVLKLGL